MQDGIIDHTIEWIASRAAAAKEGTPFFAYVPLAAPHTPIIPTPAWQGTSGINPYADFVKQVDAGVGKVLEALGAHGLAEHTIVVFTSDNGCSPSADIPQLITAGSDDPRPRSAQRRADHDDQAGGPQGSQGKMM